MADEVFEAELFEEDLGDERRERVQLNGAMGSTLVIVVLFLVLGATIGVPEDMMGANGGRSSHWLPPVEDRASKIYDDSDVFSRVSMEGAYGVSEVQSVFVAVPEITVADGGAGATGGAEVHLGLWLPNIEGCDFTIDPVPEECQVPVIAEIGPYYDDGDVDALTPADRLGRFLIENFVPHGYGVAQVSVFGTGESNHCMDLMGT